MSSSSASPASGASRSERHLWIVRGSELGNAALLLSVVLDVARWPANWTATAARFRVSRSTVRRWAGELAAAGLVLLSDRWAAATPKARALAQAGCDALPRKMVGTASPAVLRAAAVLCGETVGFLRRGIATDGERAARAGVSVGVVRQARAALERGGWITTERVRRGRNQLVRGVAVLDDGGKPMSSHGVRPRGPWMERWNRCAKAGGTRLHAPPKGGARTTRGGGSITTPTTLLRGTTLGLPPRPEPTRELPIFLDGSRSGLRNAGDVLDRILGNVPVAVASRRARADSASEAAVAELRRLAGDPDAIRRLLAMPGPRGVLELLHVLRVFAGAPKRREGVAVQLARTVGTAGLLMLALDAVLGRVRSIPAVVLTRCRRRAGGATDVLTNCRAGWTLAEFLAAVAAKGAA